MTSQRSETLHLKSLQCKLYSCIEPDTAAAAAAAAIHTCAYTCLKAMKSACHFVTHLAYIRV